MEEQLGQEHPRSTTCSSHQQFHLELLKQLASHALGPKVHSTNQCNIYYLKTFSCILPWLTKFVYFIS